MPQGSCSTWGDACCLAAALSHPQVRGLGRQAGRCRGTEAAEGQIHSEGGLQAGRGVCQGVPRTGEACCCCWNPFAATPVVARLHCALGERWAPVKAPPRPPPLSAAQQGSSCQRRQIPPESAIGALEVLSASRCWPCGTADGRSSESSSAHIAATGNMHQLGHRLGQRCTLSAAGWPHILHGRSAGSRT